MNEILNQLENNVKFYFVRHGESQYNAQHIVAGRVETPLTETGKEQAKKTGEYIAQNADISVVLHSPIGRAKNTATIITEQLPNGVPLQSCDSIVELDVGEFEHKKIADVEVEDPALFAQFKKNSWQAVPGAENINQLIDRTKIMWQRLVQIANEGNSEIAIVSHGGIMQWIFKTSLGFTGEHVASWAPIIKVSNCAIFCLRIESHIDKQEQAQSGHAIWTLLNYLAY